MADVMEEKKEELIPELKVETIPLETPATEVALEEKNVDVIAPMLELESIDAPVVQSMDKQDEEAFRMEKVSPEEIKQVNEYADKINLRDSNVIVSYGIGAQKHLSEFSDETLKQVRNKDLGAIGEELSHLMADLKYQREEGVPQWNFRQERKQGGDPEGVLWKGRDRHRLHYGVSGSTSPDASQGYCYLR